ncbi:sensor histidine kinase [Thermopetrobacter sp. TC1]|uniref:sensor histidine kinase n=1 Tax=Thermopetrobacter sp. TC1 TaxID=1495045 RepID=UPI0009DDD0CF|nr:sensor histidine kinase [Thermopetrobacter sp. TC1]
MEVRIQKPPPGASAGEESRASAPAEEARARPAAPSTDQAEAETEARTEAVSEAAENEIAVESADAPDEEERNVHGPLHWLARLKPRSLLARIVLTNLVGLVILVAGILYFNQLRENLIDARVDSLMTQARIMAAAVASSATVDTGEITLDPDRLAGMAEEDPSPPLDDISRLDFLIRPEQAGPVLRRLVKQTGTIARIYDREGVLTVDTRHLYGYGGILRLDLPPVGEQNPSLMERIEALWDRVKKWIFGHDYPLQKEYGLENGKEFPEVVAALQGASVSVVRVNKKGQIIVTVAVPIQRYKAVLGALVLSTRGGEIDAVLDKERRTLLFLFLVAGLVTLLLSVSLAGQIAEPIRRLAAAAEKVRRRVDNRRVEIPDFSDRDDEIGHLSGALREMTEALYNRIDAIESFAADVAHELKNPLTSLRSAVETLKLAKTEEQRQRLVEIVNQDVKRLDRLISDISDASRLDAELARSQAAPVDVKVLLETLVTVANETARPGEARVRLIVRRPRGMPEEKAFRVLGHDTRLAQVVQNLLANARSFSPENGEIRVILRRHGRFVEFLVEDEGPGIPEDNLEKIFERFYTDRPPQAFGQNSGLGLAISRQIVEAHQGTIHAENIYASDPVKGRKVKGARFVVRLPAMPAERTGRGGRHRN